MDLYYSSCSGKELSSSDFKVKEGNLMKTENENTRNLKAISKRTKFDLNSPDYLTSNNIFEPSQEPSKTADVKNNFSKQLTKNLNFPLKNLPFFRDSKDILDSNDSWVYSDSKFAHKLCDNSAKSEAFLSKFNDSIFN